MTFTSLAKQLASRSPTLNVFFIQREKNSVVTILKNNIMLDSIQDCFSYSIIVIHCRSFSLSPRALSFS